jgi:hypothetical protein
MIAQICEQTYLCQEPCPKPKKHKKEAKYYTVISFQGHLIFLPGPPK